VKDKRKPISPDILDKVKTAYLEHNIPRENAAYGWVRADD